MEVEPIQSSVNDTELVDTLQYNATTAQKLLESVKQQLHTVYTNTVQKQDTTTPIDNIWLDLSELKALNRTVQHTAEQYKQYINTQKLTYDSLELQSITKQYQLQYIQDQLEYTKSYTTQYQHVIDNLEDENTYIKQHNIDINTVDKHQLYLQRLDAEYKQRQALLTQLNELKQQNNDLTHIAHKKQKQLDDIDQQCTALYEFSQSLANTVLQNDVEYISADHRAEQLPTPLLTLYHNCNTYNTLIQGTGFTFSIQDTGKPYNTPDSTSTIEQLLQTHNLYIQIKQTFSSKHYVLLNVHYHPLLKFVTAQTQVYQSSNNKPVTSYNNFLTNLYSNDTGVHAPYNIDTVTTAIPSATQTIESYLQTNKAYIWLQQMCALNGIVSNSTDTYTLTEILQRIVHRFATYTALLHQIDLLSNSKPVKSILPHAHTNCQTRIGKLTAQTSATDASIQCAVTYTHPLQASNELTATISIYADYPLNVPTFKLTYNASEDIQSYVTQLEHNINTLTSLPVDRTQLVQLESTEQFALLSWQINRLQYMVDRLIAAQHAIASNENIDQYISTGKDRLLILD